MAENFDLIVENGLVFDGKANTPERTNIGIKNGTIEKISRESLSRESNTQVIDASRRWVMPGFIDLHTHYDAEVEFAPSLSESVRHGVTTVVLGSCSLSLTMGTPEDLADMFCRVEAIPYNLVYPLLKEKKTWEGTGEYFSHLRSLPLGPNVASFLGHSCLRSSVMGLERSLEKSIVPSEQELARMEDILHKALNQGYLGLSIQTLPWDKMGGSRYFRSRPLPSTFARWSEYRRLNGQLRERGKIFQGVPNVSTKVNVILFLLESMGLWRKPLKTTVISMMDIRETRGIYRVIGTLSRLFNTALNADFRWQALPNVFDLWADGIDLVVFEEFGAGTAALHLQDAAERASLLRDPVYRKRFRKEWTSKFLPKVFHRDFNQSEILKCPDSKLIGKSFAQIAKEQNMHSVDVFLDLVARYGNELRWYTVMANDREEALQYIIKHPDVLIGFSDAGAHLRNMSHYNFPLRLFRLVRKALERGTPFMTLEQAVYRVTSEIADWLGLDAGTIETGKRADIVILDPEGLDDTVEDVFEEPMEGFPQLHRLVRRNDKAVHTVLINGCFAVKNHQISPNLGKEKGYGQVLSSIF